MADTWGAGGADWGPSEEGGGEYSVGLQHATGSEKGPLSTGVGGDIISGSIDTDVLMGGHKNDVMKGDNPNALVGVIAAIIGMIIGGPIGAAIGLLGMNKNRELTAGIRGIGNITLTGDKAGKVEPGFVTDALTSEDPLGHIGHSIGNVPEDIGSLLGDLDIKTQTTPQLSMEDWLTQQYMQEGAPEEFLDRYQGLVGVPTVEDPYTAEARLSQINDIISRIQGETAIPEGLSEEEFNSIMAQQMFQRDIGLGPDVTEQQVSDSFAGSNLGDLILQQEEADRQTGWNQQIGDVFTGQAFQPLDDSIINSILDERQGTSQQTLANYGARGNLNLTGGQTAQRILGEQREKGATRLGEIGRGVLGGSQRDVDVIRDRATGAASDYKLGDPLFDIGPYQQERQQLVTEREGSLRPDIEGALGGEPLFDVGAALGAAGRTQGVVSGPQASLLDTIAARQGGSERYKERGLGSRGVF